MADFQNHGRSTLKCIKQEIIPVSERLKTNIKTSRGLQIIRAEKQLLNECIRSINNMLEVYMYKREIYFHQLRELLDQNTFEECKNLINRVIECRHQRVLGWPKVKFEALYQQKISGHSNMGGCSNHATTIRAMKSDQSNEATDTEADKTSTWVKNSSNTPLTGAQECLLAHGPKFAISPKHPSIGKYIAAMEQACSKLVQGEAEELRVEVEKALKKIQRPPVNITKEEYKATNELKKDDSRMILTTDKGVALVVIDKADYIKMAEELLNKPTHKKIPEDPTNKQKTKLINLLKNIKAEGGITEETYKRIYPTGAGSPKFYGLSKIHKPGIPLMSHSAKHSHSYIQPSQRVGQDLETTTWDVCTPCPQQQGLCRTSKRHKATIGRIHHLI